MENLKYKKSSSQMIPHYETYPTNQFLPGYNVWEQDAEVHNALETNLNVSELIFSYLNPWKLYYANMIHVNGKKIRLVTSLASNSR